MSMTQATRAASAGVALPGASGRGGAAGARAIGLPVPAAAVLPGARAPAFLGASPSPAGRTGRSERCSVRASAFQEHPGADDMELRRKLLTRYVEEVDPKSMEAFTDQAPPEVVKAMKETVTNMLGTLPPQFFDIKISTMGENLAQLMYSLMMTGYMFRNAQYRLELQNSMLSLPGGVGDIYSADVQGRGDQEPGQGLVTYAPGTQRKGVKGSVVRWNESADAPEEFEVGEYLDRLEAELDVLRDQLSRERRAGVDRNKILEYLKGLEPNNLQELTSSAGSDVLEAMNSFIARLVGRDEAELKEQQSENTSAEMARLLYWLLVVGYSLRTMEVRLDMQRSVGVPPAMSNEPNGLPPGI